MENEEFEITPLPGQEALGEAPAAFAEGPAPAGFNERFVAYVIDAFPFVAATHLTMGAAVKAGIISRGTAGEWEWKLLWTGVYIVYETIFSSGGRATLGKFLMNLRVRAADGGNLSFGKALVRAFSYFLSSFTLDIGFLMALFTPQKRALHDYAAGSRVISLRERGDLANGLVLAASWGLMAIFMGSWLNQTVLKITPSEKKQIFAAHRTISKIAKLEEIYLRREGHYTNDLKRLADLTGNVNAVRAELYRTLTPDSLAIASNGNRYLITAKARNWRRTEVQISSPEKAQSKPDSVFPAP
jgi:uncharacterized RDD family membrane protein YckC